MHDTEKALFKTLITDAMAYYSKDVSKFMLQVFWDALKRFDFQDVSRAFSLHAQNPDNGQWAPKVADILKLIEGSTATQGMTAWAKVHKAIGSVGRMRSVAFDDPLIHVVLDEMGGWYALCSTSEAELPFKAREFEKRYQGYRLRRETPPFSPYLIGGHEAENRSNGYATPTPPALVGDPERAALVMERGSREGAVRITDGRTASRFVAKRLAAMNSSDDNDPEPPRAA
jgi:hypothetical protein